MFTAPSLVKDILRKKECITKRGSGVYNILEDLFNGSLEREALQHSLRIEFPLAEILDTKDRRKYKRDLEKQGTGLKESWEYRKKNFRMPFDEEYLIELAYRIEPEAFEEGKRYRKYGSRPRGSSVTRPYPEKIGLEMKRFFDALNILYEKSKNLKINGSSISEKYFDLGAWIHLNLLRIHPFGDVNGRTARMINNLYLNSNAFPPIIIYEGERQSYSGHIEKAIKGIRERDGTLNGALTLGRDEISDGEKNFYDYLATKLNITLDEVISKKAP